MFKLSMLLQVLTNAVGLVEDGLKGNKYITVTIKDIQAYVRLASLIKTNYTRLHEALGLCRSALEKVPNDFRATRETGHVLLHMMKFEDARMYFEQALGLNPSDPNANFLLGVTFGELGRLDQAESSIRHALRLTSDAGSRNMYENHLRTVLQMKSRSTSHRGT